MHQKMFEGKILSSVRSFVRRQGRITPSQKRALEALWPIYGIDTQPPFSFNELFPSIQPYILEIGFGMGQSLIEQAKQMPQYNFIGIEVYLPGIGNLLCQLEKEGIQNVRIFNGDAVQIIPHYIPDNSLTKVQIFFPDPWPKKKHHKRRLIQPAFIQLICQKLQSKGIIHLATDWEHYAYHMLDVLSKEILLVNQAGENKFSNNDGRPLTKFEKRGLGLGHQLWDILFSQV